MFILCRRVAVVKILSLDVAKIEKHRLLVHLVKVVVVLPLILVVVKMVIIYTSSILLVKGSFMIFIDHVIPFHSILIINHLYEKVKPMPKVLTFLDVTGMALTR